MANIGEELRELWAEPLELPAPVRPASEPTPEIETPAEVEQPVEV